MRLEHILLITGMSLVTYIPRALPLLLLSSRELNPWIVRWLALVPPAVIAAILVQTLFFYGSPSDAQVLNVSFGNTFLLAAVPAFLVSWFTRSFLGTVVTGMLATALLRLFI